MSNTPTAVMQRSRGRAEVAFRGPGLQLDRLVQEGSAKAILPAVQDGAPEVVFLNTAGGLAGGDRLDYALAVPEGGRVVATTQTAERAYRATDDTARVRLNLSVGAGGWLDWLPQETILYDGCRLDREVTVDLGSGAGCLFLETVILGRHAMGEVLAGLYLRDSRRVLRDGRPLWTEPMLLDTASLRRSGAPTILGGARAFATLALVRDGAGDAVSALRAVLDEPGVEAAASGFDGRCVVRFLAWDGLPLRRQVIRAIRAIRPGPLPRVWQV
jgi:urease accessory protein